MFSLNKNGYFYCRKMSNDSLWFFNGLKGIMCLSVILYHYTYRYYELSTVFNPLTTFFRYGGVIGVCVFFLMTGFLTMHTIGRFKEIGGIKWLIHKYMRLYPQYAMASLIIFIVTYFYNLPFREPPTLQLFLMNLTMFPGLGGGLDTAHWYIMTLVYFYLEIYMIKKTESIQKLWPYLTIILLHSLIVISRHFKLVDENTGIYILTYILNLQPFIGVMIYNALTINKNWWIMVLLSCILLRNIILLPVISTFIILLLIPKDKIYIWIVRTLNCRIILSVSGISYMWYLIHQNIGYVVITICNGYYNDWISILLAMFATLVLSYILSKIYFLALNENKSV